MNLNLKKQSFKEPRIFLNLTLNQTYILIFSLLVFWASFAFFTMKSLIDSQQIYGKLINFSGKQRMLSQKTALISSRYFHEKDEKLFIHLNEIVKLAKSDYEFITTNLTSDELTYYYFKVDGLDHFMKEYFDFLNDFIKNPTLDNLLMVQERSFSLLPKIDKAVNIFQNEFEELTKKLEDREFLIYIGTILTLLIEFIFIVRPITKSVNDDFSTILQDLYEKNEELALYSNVFKYAVEGIVITDKDEKILAVNGAFTKITGYEKDEAIGNTPKILSSGRHDKEFYRQMWDGIIKDGFWQGEIINRKKDKELFYEWVSIIKIEDRDFKPLYYISIFSDMTPYHESKLHLEFMATHDYLTRLPNRNLLNDRIEHAISKAKRFNTKVAVIFMDLDNFKIINDTLGHDKGDEMLIAISKRVLAIIRECDTLARIGGDEFVVLIEDFTDVSVIVPIVEKIMQNISTPLIVSSHSVTPHVSIGISIFPDDTMEQKQLISYADMAMYKTKDSGKNSYNFFTKDLNEKASMRMKIEHELVKAIENGEFKLYYQPKINIKTEKIVGVEALIRWQSKTKGMVSPLFFIPIAEESDLIIDIGNFVIKESLNQLDKWKNTIFRNLHIAINVSAKQFMQKNFYENLQNIAKDYNVLNNLIVELTESVLVQDFEQTLHSLNLMRQDGIMVAIDDFGTGYSSLSYLKKLPIDSLKIDRSFVKDIETDKDDISIIEAIISMSNKLGISVVAEGVESEFQKEFLLQNDCKIVQGFLYSKPLPLNELEKWIIENNMI